MLATPLSEMSALATGCICICAGESELIPTIFCLQVKSIVEQADLESSLS